MPTNDKQYMNEYMKKRYDTEIGKKYQKALRWKTTKNISNEMWQKYKHHLVEVIKLQEILQSLLQHYSSDVIHQLSREKQHQLKNLLDELKLLLSDTKRN